MKKLFCTALASLGGFFLSAQSISDSAATQQIFREVLAHGQAYQNLQVLCKQVGHRISGSPQAAAAVEWGVQAMKKAGYDTVLLQPVKVPKWVRGNTEDAVLIQSNGIQKTLRVKALGMSVATPSEGITAEVVEVFNLDTLKTFKKDALKGKIIFFNRPMNPHHFSTFMAYGGCVDQRGGGAASAAPFGAVAVIVRSMTLMHDGHAHTGSMRYTPGGNNIPATAIALEDADMLSNQLKRFPGSKVHLNLSCHHEDSVWSNNVIGVIRGTKYPEQIITVGGHLDSWDVGEGAHDDGAGCAQSIEAGRLLLQLGLRPERTVHVVLFMNEENGACGAVEYAKCAVKNKEKHIFAIESDAGGYTPRYWGVSADGTTTHKQMDSWLKYFSEYGIDQVLRSGGGVDIGQLRDAYKIPTAGYLPDSQRYFDVHHADTDVFEAIHPRELHLGAGHLALMVYLVGMHGI
jgi:carboxypeptidase Q